MGQRLFHEGYQTAPVGKFNVFLGEIQFQFHEGGHLQQFVAQFFQPGRIPAAKLVHRHPVGGGIVGLDDICNGFSLS